MFNSKRNVLTLTQSWEKDVAWNSRKRRLLEKKLSSSVTPNGVTLDESADIMLF